MTTKKRHLKIFALIFLAVFAVFCVFGVSACSSYDDMTDVDAAALYAALLRTDNYEGSFTVVNTESGSERDSETEDGEKYSSSEDYEDKYTTSYDAESGYLVYKNDGKGSWNEEEEEEKDEGTYLYSDYYYYVPKDDESLTLYRYSYELEEGEEWQSKTKEDVSYSNSNYKKYSSLSDRTYLSYYYGKTAWTTVDDLKDCLGGDSLEVEKKNKETVYKITETEEEKSSGTESGEKYSYEFKEIYVLEFHVNSEGFVTEYTETDTYSVERTEGKDSWSEEETWSDSYTISYSFDGKLKLAEKEMADYTEK